jgi:hypothetical protein
MALRQFLQQYGSKDTIERVKAQIAMKLCGDAVRKYSGSPTLLEFHGMARAVSDAVEEVVAVTLPEQYDSATLRALLEEFEALEEELKRRVKSRKLALPEYYGVEGKVARLLYTLVRLTRPTTVLETGVANGQSSFFILNALMRNDQGTLHSVDVDPDAGILVEDSEKARWSLHILDGSKRRYTELIATLPMIDFYIHDSNHSYWWMRFELEATLPRMARSALIACDDADHSYGFFDFCQEHALKPMLLLDPRNVYGVLPLCR